MATKGTTTRAAIYTRKSSLDDRSGAGGLVFAAVITGIFHWMRRENDAAHGESIAKLEDNGRTTARSTRPQVPFCATGRAPPTKPSAEHFRAPDPLHYASHVVRDSDVMGRHC